MKGSELAILKYLNVTMLGYSESFSQVCCACCMAEQFADKIIIIFFNIINYNILIVHYKIQNNNKQYCKMKLCCTPVKLQKY